MLRFNTEENYLGRHPAVTVCMRGIRMLRPDMQECKYGTIFIDLR